MTHDHDKCETSHGNHTEPATLVSLHTYICLYVLRVYSMYKINTFYDGIGLQNWLEQVILYICMYNAHIIILSGKGLESKQRVINFFL